MISQMLQSTGEIREDPLATLLNNYHSLNANVVDEFNAEEPSALEFMRYVARNRPFVVRRAARQWEAFQRWDASYLRQKMGSEQVQVVVTPKGNADAVVEDENGDQLFVEPHESLESFRDVLDYIQEDSRLLQTHQNETAPTRPVKYAQTRTYVRGVSTKGFARLIHRAENDNLRNEYATLFDDVPSDISFARIALQKTADAINFWLGNDRSVTSLHKDNYENIFVQIRGTKHFTLLPPVEMPCVNEQNLVRARYVLRDGEFEIVVDDVDEKAPVAIWDPDPDLGSGVRRESTRHATPYSHLSQPLRVTLHEGDMLYLPSLWYHKVAQTSGDEGFVCAVNYWYDLDFAGQFWSSHAFVRDVFHSGAGSRAEPST